MCVHALPASFAVLTSFLRRSQMWSLGCIIAEMYTGYPIFPGENEQEQLACIMEVMGLPDKYLVDRSSRKRLFFGKLSGSTLPPPSKLTRLSPDSTGAPRPVVNSKGRRRRPGSKTLAQVLKSDDDLFVDFISKCLTWDPDRRLKPDPALRRALSMSSAWLLLANVSRRPLDRRCPSTRREPKHHPSSHRSFLPRHVHHEQRLVVNFVGIPDLDPASQGRNLDRQLDPSSLAPLVVERVCDGTGGEDEDGEHDGFWSATAVDLEGQLGLAGVVLSLFHSREIELIDSFQVSSFGSHPHRCLS